MRTELRERCEQFKRWLEREQGLRPSTARAYSDCLGPYLRSAGTLRPGPEVALAYREALLDRALAPSTVANALFAIERYHEMQGEPVQLRKPKGKRAMPRYLTMEEAHELLFACDRARDYAILNVLLYGGLRVSELCALDVGDWNPQDRTLAIREGKGGKPRVVLLGEKATVALEDWLQKRSRDEGGLFLARSGGRLQRGDVNRLVKRWARVAGLQKRVTAHMLRHTFASHALRSGMALTDVQAQLGHASATTTLGFYAHAMREGRREAYDKTAPKF